MALFFSNNKKRKRTAAKGNYAFRRKKKKKQPEAADIHRLEMNPETEASRRQIMLKRAGTGARWAFGMLAAILFLSLMKVVVMEAFVKNAKFQLQKVQVVTAGPITEDAIREACGLRIGDNLLMISLRDVRDRVEAMPGVRAVGVKREFPGLIVIDVEQRTPVAWLECPEKNLIANDLRYGCLLDGQGYVLPGSHHTAAVAARLPVIRVKNFERAAPNALVESTSALRALKLLKTFEAGAKEKRNSIVKIDANREHAFVTTFASGLITTFPAFGSFPEEFRRLQVILEESAHRGLRVATVNLLVEHDVPVTIKTDPDRNSRPRSVAVAR